jgi:hypothetical protein
MELVDVRLQEPIPCEMSNGENVFGDLCWRSNQQTGSVDEVKCEEVVVKYNVQTSLTRLCHCIQSKCEFDLPTAILQLSNKFNTGFPPRSPALTPMDFGICGYSKENGNLTINEELQEEIPRRFRNIDQQCYRIFLKMTEEKSSDVWSVTVENNKFVFVDVRNIYNNFVFVRVRQGCHREKSGAGSVDGSLRREICRCGGIKDVPRPISQLPPPRRTINRPY